MTSHSASKWNRTSHIASLQSQTNENFHRHMSYRDNCSKIYSDIITQTSIAREGKGIQSQQDVLKYFYTDIESVTDMSQLISSHDWSQHTVTISMHSLNSLVHLASVHFIYNEIDPNKQHNNVINDMLISCR